ASGVTSPQLRVLVIGHNGQVSSSLCEVLPAAGYDVVRLGRPDIDLSNSNIVVDAILASRPDVVINPAAYTAVDKAEDEPLVAQAINIDGAEVVASAA